MTNNRKIYFNGSRRQVSVWLHCHRIGGEKLPAQRRNGLVGLAKLTGHFGDLAQQGAAMALASIRRIDKNIFHITVIEVATVPDGRVLIADKHDTSRVLNDGFILQDAALPRGIWLPFAQSPPLVSGGLVRFYPSLGSPTSREQTACRMTGD